MMTQLHDDQRQLLMTCVLHALATKAPASREREALWDLLRLLEGTDTVIYSSNPRRNQ